MKLFQGTGERPCLLDTMFSHGQRDCSYSYSEGQILVWWLQELRMSVGSEHTSAILLPSWFQYLWKQVMTEIAITFAVERLQVGFSSVLANELFSQGAGAWRGKRDG